MLSKIKFFGAFLQPRFVLFIFFICYLILCTTGVYALNQAEITAAMGAGWNLGNTMEAFNDYGPFEDAWGNPKVTYELFTAVKNAGFKSVRIPVSLLTAIGPAPDYTIDPEWFARVKEVIDYAYDQGLYVILDGLHGDGYPTINTAWLLVEAPDQAAVIDKFTKIWLQYADLFKDYDEHMIFESMNEIGNDTWYDPDPALYVHLNAYNQVFVDTIRQTGGNNASRWLLIPGWNTNIDYMTLDFGFVIPTDNYRSSSIPGNEKRLMISAHYYTPWEFCGDSSSPITQWGVITADPSKTTTCCQEDYMESQFALMYWAFVTEGYPVIIGEYCATDKTDQDPTNNTYRIYFNKTLCTFCSQYGAVPVYWDIGVYGPGASGLIDRHTYNIVESGIINAIMTGINTHLAPDPTPSPTGAPPVGPGANITVLYKCGDTNAIISAINPSFRVRNDDTSTIPLSSVKIRYWYNRDGGHWQSFTCDYAVVGNGNITGNMVRIPLSEQTDSTANFYVEIGFNEQTGSLSPGADSGEIQIRLNKFDWSDYDQSNDYSFNAAMTDYGQNTKVTGYVNNLLVFGTEPAGSGPVQTPVPTPTPTLVPTTVPTAGPTTPNTTNGDVDGSGTVDIVDALLVAQYYVGLNPDNFTLEAADVDCSGGIDIVDALLIAQYYVGLISGFQC